MKVVEELAARIASHVHSFEDVSHIVGDDGVSYHPDSVVVVQVGERQRIYHLFDIYTRGGDWLTVMAEEGGVVCAVPSTPPFHEKWGMPFEKLREKLEEAKALALQVVEAVKEKPLERLLEQFSNITAHRTRNGLEVVIRYSNYRVQARVESEGYVVRVSFC